VIFDLDPLLKNDFCAPEGDHCEADVPKVPINKPIAAVRLHSCSGKSGSALAGTEHRLIAYAFRLVV